MAGKSKYTPELVAQVKELFEDGNSLVQIAKKVGVNRQSLYNWSNPEHKTYKPEFKLVIEEGKENSQAWWLDQGKENIHNNKFNTALYKYLTCVMFGWSERQEVTTTSTIQVSSQSKENVAAAFSVY